MSMSTRNHKVVIVEYYPVLMKLFGSSLGDSNKAAAGATVAATVKTTKMITAVEGRAATVDTMGEERRVGQAEGEGLVDIMMMIQGRSMRTTTMMTVMIVRTMTSKTASESICDNS